MPSTTSDIQLAVIAGSKGFLALQKLGGQVETLDPVETPFGASPPIHVIESDGRMLAVISRHGEHGYTISAPSVNYRANIWALKEIGVQRIVAWSGPGAIDPSIPIGGLLVPGDIVDETHGRPSTFYEGLGIGFIRQNPVFCPELSARCQEVIRSRQGHCRTDDVYVCTQGPRLETPAEIRKFASYGGTLVGMTLVPEAFLAKELEICYCPICYVTNYAEGVMERPYRPGMLFEGLLGEEERQRVDAAAASVLDVALEVLLGADGERACPCAVSMERYRKRGDIGDDWHTWIERRE